MSGEPNLIRNNIIEEPRLIKGENFCDSRGVVSFVNNFNFSKSKIKRFYVVENHKVGFVRAWHAHKNENKYVFVVSGVALIGAVKINDFSHPSANIKPKKFVLSGGDPKILHIPAGCANGFKTLSEKAKIIFFSTSTLEESLDDDYRFPYDLWNIWEENFR